MSDRIAVFNEGRIEQVGTPAEIYERPATRSSPASSAPPTCSTGRPPRDRSARAGTVQRPAREDPRRSTRSPRDARRAGDSSAAGTRRRGRLPGRRHALPRRPRRRRTAHRARSRTCETSSDGRGRVPRAPGSRLRWHRPACRRGRRATTDGHHRESGVRPCRRTTCKRGRAVHGARRWSRPPCRLVAAPACGSAVRGGGRRRRDCPSADEARRERGRRSTSSPGPATSRTAATTRRSTGSPPFEKETGCKVNVKTFGTSDEAVNLMKTGDYDVVSASGDASLRLIAAGDVGARSTPTWSRTTRTSSTFLKDQAVELGRRRSVRRPARPGRQPADVQHRRGQARADSWGVGLRRRLARTRARSPRTTRRSTSPTPRCT